MRIKLAEASAARLSGLLTPYITTLQVVVEAMGLQGTWTFDPLTGELVSVEATEAPVAQPESSQ